MALSFAVSGVAVMSLDKFLIGVLLLSGLFVYDVFWVFGTDVMVTVAKSFDAPIKGAGGGGRGWACDDVHGCFSNCLTFLLQVLFPRDFLAHGIWGKELAMLGLGDIVLPGIFVALLLRFDQK